MTRVHEALTYRAHRLSPIPFFTRSKTPAFDEGEIFAYRQTPATPAQLRTLFADPTLNIGVLTGNGHIVVDVDGDEGQQSLKGLPLPTTPTVITSDDTHRHLHFRAPADDGLRTRIRPLPGIDILADDWQVLMPSSTHPNHHTYTWAPGHGLTDLELTAPPAWLLDLCRSSAVAPPPVLSNEREQVSTRKSLLEDGRARVATDVPESDDDSLLAPCMFPTTLDALGGWPALLRREDVNLRCMDYLGVFRVDIGTRFACPMPGHPTDRRAASLFWDHQTKAPTGMLKLRDWHYATGDRTYNQADIFASRCYGEALQLKGAPEIAVWQLRLLLAAGVLLPYPVHAAMLPPKTPRHIVRVYEGYLDLLRAKWLHTPGEATPFTWRFAAAWCGMRSVGQVVYALRWLLRKGYLRQAGSHKRMALFLPGAP